MYWGAISEEGGMDAKKKKKHKTNMSRMVKQALGWDGEETFGSRV